MKTSSRSAGFTLMEALIALVILATGLLAIARFQSGLVSTSASNKARAEAIMLAQQKIDEIRSYSDEPDLVANLNAAAYDASKNFQDDVVSDAQVPDTPEDKTTVAALSGINADFQRVWEIKKTPTTAEINVTVTWEDANSGADASGNVFTESVTLSTEIVFQDPGLVGEQSLDDPQPLIPNTTGRSRLGEGHYDPVDVLPTMDTRDNDDGTVTYDNLDTKEVELIDTTTGDVLLTLEEACNVTDGGQTVCTDFVKINGLIWVDDGSLTGDPDLSTIYVLASDNAVCTHKTSVAINTGTYRYYPYRCYLGGGWSGNLGIIQTGGTNQQGEVCIGDPDSLVNEPIIAARRVYRGMLSRDLFTGTGRNNPGRDLTTDDALPLPNGNDGIEEFDAIGVADALEMPNFANENINAEYNAGNYDPFGRLYLPGHNFMITNLGATPENADCVAPMTDPEVVVALYDSADASANFVKNVDAFFNTKDEFVCMNQVYPYDTTDASGNTISALQLYFDAIDTRIEDGYLEVNNDQIKYEETTVDASGNSVFTIAATQAADASGNISSTNIINIESNHLLIVNECPYNPADNVTQRSFVFGSLYLTANADGYTPTSVVPGMVVNTSDDIAPGLVGNCDVYTRAAVGSGDRGSDLGTDGAPGAGVMADYVCSVYHTYDAADPNADDPEINGWNGTISIYPASSFSCGIYNDNTVSSYTYPAASAITTDTGDLTGAASTLDFVCSYTGFSGSDLVTTVVQTASADGLDSSPTEGSAVRLLISVTNNGPADATGVSLTVPVTPTGLTNVVYTPNSGTFSGTAWDIGSLASGATATMFIDYDVGTGLVCTTPQYCGSPSVPITFELADPATGDQDDDTTEGDVLSVELIPTIGGTTPPNANLVITTELKSNDTTPFIGDTVTYAVTVENLGGDTATAFWVAFGLDKSTLVDPGVTPPTHVSQPDSSGNNQGLADWIDDGNHHYYYWYTSLLNPEQSRTIEIDLQAAASGTITSKLLDWADWNPSYPGPVLTYQSWIDPSTINDVLTDTSATVVDPAASDMLTTVSVSSNGPSEGEMVTITITIENKGPAAITGNSITTDFNLDNTGSINGLTLLTSGSTYPSNMIQSILGNDCSTDARFNCLNGTWDGFQLGINQSRTVTLKARVDTGALSESPITLSTTRPTSGNDDGIREDLDTLSQALNVGVVYEPATISGSLDRYPSPGASKLSTVTVQLVDHADQLTGSVVNCTVAGSKTSYTCSINFDSSQHKGAVLSWTPVTGTDVSCYNSKLNGSTLQGDSNYSTATKWWIENINTVTTTQKVVIATSAGLCQPPTP